jgi:hypothetical protein
VRSAWPSSHARHRRRRSRRRRARHRRSTSTRASGGATRNTRRARTRSRSRATPSCSASARPRAGTSTSQSRCSRRWPARRRSSVNRTPSIRRRDRARALDDQRLGGLAPPDADTGILEVLAIAGKRRSSAHRFRREPAQPGSWSSSIRRAAHADHLPPRRLPPSNTRTMAPRLPEPTRPPDLPRLRSDRVGTRRFVRKKTPSYPTFLAAVLAI